MGILIVDDSEFIHPLLKVYLAAGGHSDLVFCTSAQEAFEVLGLEGAQQPRPPFELVLMDVAMPGMDGIEATRILKDAPAFSELPVIMVTADTAPETLKAALEAGASDYIAKPINKVELLARVDAALRLKRETDRRLEQERELRRQRADLKDAFERIAGEMDLVARLQGLLLPRRSPRIPGLTISSLYRPSGRASGDYFDHFTTGPGAVRLVVADVSGHGAQAAFIMAIVRTLFHAGAEARLSLERTMDLVNSHLCESFAAESDFVTILALDLDLDAGRLSYVNAGHCPCLLLPEDAPVHKLAAQAPPTGFVETDYEAVTLPLSERGKLFLFTDGLYEWQVEPGRVFGLEPFLLLSEELLRGSGQGDFLGGVEERLRTLTGSKPDFDDDLTALLAAWDLSRFRGSKG